MELPVYPNLYPETQVTVAKSSGKNELFRSFFQPLFLRTKKGELFNELLSNPGSRDQ